MQITILRIQSDAPLELHTALPQMSHIRVLGILACDFKWATFFFKDVADCCRKLQAFAFTSRCVTVQLHSTVANSYYQTNSASASKMCCLLSLLY
jgi:hypothetical protein